MDKSWIYDRERTRPNFQNGVLEFINFAKNSLKEGETDIICPCTRCRLRKKWPKQRIKEDLVKFGFHKNYTNWVLHGEPSVRRVGETRNTELQNDENSVQQVTDDMCEVLEDLGYADLDAEPNDEVFNNCHMNGHFMENVLAAKQELYPGCNKYTQLSFIVQLLHIKVLNNWSNKSFDMLLKLLKDAMPEGYKIPSSHYESKRLLAELGLGYENIHACPNDCILYWKEHEDLNQCPVCDETRFKENSRIKSKVPKKVMRYFPLKPRLQRLFLSRHTAKEMRWHKEVRLAEEGVLRHPADGEAWKSFDKLYPAFAADSRNVRLGLATDGFNPFGNMSTSYSMWPVVLVCYNFPPWKTMKQPNIILSTLIPGPKSPGQDIDVYLRPLMEELKALWVDGVDSYDSFKQESFKLHASLMWTINDFPAYAAISGWSTKGYKACPTCLDDNTSLGVINKISYFGHRRFLPKGHKWRRCKLFNGDTDTRNPPLVKSGEDILVEINDIDYEPFGKKRAQQMRKRKRKFVKSNWKKKSIMFELDYWSKLKLRHNLDVMHIEKNVCDNLLGTLLNLKKKTKDTINARLDLQQWNIRKDLWIQEKDGRMIKPAASYTLSKDEAKAFCKFLKSIKFPDGYASNISRCADDESGRISGLKSHDCHVMIQRLLPIGIRGFMPDNISEVVVELGSFFKKLCARTLVVDDLEEMEKGIVLVLCKMEKIFPPAFFDVMVHLCVHLPREGMLGGPVASRWMYPIERYLGKLKNYVRNNAKPEGCIAEGYVADEALTFCSMYFSGKETIFNRQERNYDVDTDTVLRGSLSVFSMPIRNLEGHQRFRLSKKEINIAHWYVISNCIELESYLEEHAASAPIGMSDVELERWQQDNFSNWFKQRMCSTNDVFTEPNICDELKSLVDGPGCDPHIYTGCVVNGVRFHSIARGSSLASQNSGVMTPGNHVGQDIEFYGILEDIVRLDYLGGYKVWLFKCKWFDNNPMGKRLLTNFGFTCIDISRYWYKEDPYILASQAKQVFYILDTKHGANWRVVQTIDHRHLWDVIEAEQNTENNCDNISEPFQEVQSNNVYFGVDDNDYDHISISRLNAEGEEVNLSESHNTIRLQCNIDDFINDVNVNETFESSASEENSEFSDNYSSDMDGMLKEYYTSEEENADIDLSS